MIGLPTGKVGAHHRGDALKLAQRGAARRREGIRHIALLGAGVPAILFVATGGYLSRITLGLPGLENVFLRTGEPFRGLQCSSITGAAERLAIVAGDGYGSRSIPATAPPLIARFNGAWFDLFFFLFDGWSTWRNT